MRAGLRFGMTAFAAGLAFAGAPALGQSAAPPPSAPNTTAPETVGPRELQNFSLNGTVTREADKAPPARPSAPRTTDARPQRPSTSTVAERPEPQTQSTPTSRVAERQAPSPPKTAESAPALTPDVGAPTEAAKIPAGAISDPGFSSDLVTAPPTLAPERSLTLWPWLLLAAVIGGAAGLLFWRRRSREAFEGGPQIDAFTPPEPRLPVPRAAPVPVPQSAPPPAPKAARPKPVGLVSSKLRPWLEVSFKPLRCVVDGERLALDFEVELFNSGGSPARDILVEACMFGASATQEQDIAAFFAKPAGAETPVALIAPLQRLNLRSSLVAARTALAPVDVGGQPMLVPVMAFNAVYRSAGSEARTSVTYLLGRETKSDKLAPFPAEAAPRAYEKLDARPLPMGVRR